VTERVMIEVLRDELASTKAAGARRAAADAIAHARVSVLAPALHDLVAPTIAAELRLAAITAAATLDDRSVTGELVAALPADLADDPRVAVASVSALVQLGQRAAAEAAIRRATPHPAALAALAVVRVPALDAKLEAWFARGGVGTRAAVCAALVTPATRALLLRGLRDPDASVRAACAATAATLGARGAGRAVVARLRELARDRDHLVRAQAIAALAAVGGGRVAGAARDSAPEVRAAAAARATDDELVALAADPEPDVRAAAIAVLGARATKEARAAIARAATDEAPQVRRAAIPSITDDPALQRLAADDAPEVASDALVALVQRRGRAASTSALVARLAANAGDRERVRIALAWLLAPRP
jgi:hypothetical protein